MKCKECGGKILFSKGAGICESCGRTITLDFPYEKNDVFICVSPNDVEEIAQKENKIALEIKNTLAKAKINSKTQRINNDEDSDGFNYYSAYNSRVIVLVGVTVESFDKLVKEYEELLSEKLVISVYSGVLPKDLPERIKKLQALNYDSLASMTDLEKGIREHLGIKSEVEIEELNKQAQKKKRTIIIVSILSAAILIPVVVSIFISSAKKQTSVTETMLETTTSTTTSNTVETTLSDDEIFDLAKENAKKGKYIDAIELFISLGDYPHCEDELSNIYSKYAGYYYDEDNLISFHLSKTGNTAGIVEISKSFENGKVMITENFQFKGQSTSIQFNDSENNKGTVTLILQDDAINLSIVTDTENSELYFNDSDIVFLLANKSDNPITALSDEKIREWLSDNVSKDDIERDGFSLVQFHTEEGRGYYQIEDTKIVLYLMEYDPINNRFTDEDYLYGVGGPASIILNDYIGEDARIIEDDGFLYIPGGSLDTLEGQSPRLTDTVIESDTQILVLSVDVFGDDLVSKIYTKYDQSYAALLANEQFKSDYDESDTYYDYLDTFGNYYFVYAASYSSYIAFYKVDKDDFEVEFYMEFSSENHSAYQIYRDPDYAHYFTDTAIIGNGVDYEDEGVNSAPEYEEEYEYHINSDWASEYGYIGNSVSFIYQENESNYVIYTFEYTEQGAGTFKLSLMQNGSYSEGYGTFEESDKHGNIYFNDQTIPFSLYYHEALDLYELYVNVDGIDYKMYLVE